MNNEILISREYRINFTKPLIVKIFKPEVDLSYSQSRAKTYKVEFLIEGLDHEYMSKAYGLDELQAIYKAFITIGNLLYSSKEYADGNITFNGGFDLQLPTSDAVVGYVSHQSKLFLNNYKKNVVSASFS